MRGWVCFSCICFASHSSSVRIAHVACYWQFLLLCCVRVCWGDHVIGTEPLSSNGCCLQSNSLAEGVSAGFTVLALRKPWKCIVGWWYNPMHFSYSLLFCVSHYIHFLVLYCVTLKMCSVWNVFLFSSFVQHLWHFESGSYNPFTYPPVLHSHSWTVSNYSAAC
jgi:hypothetical protein